MPTTIKNKEYIGISCIQERNGYGFSGKIITQNTYNNFGELKLDSPDGATTLE